MLRQRGKESVPPLITDAGRLIAQQRGLNTVRLPAVLLHELPHELPPHLDVSCPYQAASKICHGHGTVVGHGATSEVSGAQSIRCTAQIGECHDDLSMPMAC